MKRKLFRTMAGLSAGFLTLSIGAGSICESWKGTIDTYMGTTSSRIETKDKSLDGTYTYTSDYGSTDELLQAHKDLNETLSEEGSVLMKNNGTLPLKSGDAVTLFGTNSHYPYYGGQMGGSVEESQAVSLETALEESGFKLNPTMIQLYDDMGQIEGEETKDSFGNTMKTYLYRPGEIGLNLMTGVATSGYRVGEPPLSLYEETNPDYKDSFAEYNDAAIVMVGRTGTEGGDYVPGEEGMAEGESGSTALELNKEENAMIDLACENFDKVVVLVNSINPMEIEELKNNDQIDAILWVGFPGCYGFNGVADVLNGEQSPSGHLTDTYAVDSLSAPSTQNYGYFAYTNGDGDRIQSYVVEAEGIYIGYKYYETRYADYVAGNGNADAAVGASNGTNWKYEDEVSYSFGHGLSYTTFDQKLNSVTFNEDNTVTVDVTITNTGDVAGKDVAQIYLQSPYTDYDKQNKVEKSAVSLMDYVKSDILEPGQSQTLTTTFDMEYMASYDYVNAKTYIMDAGDYYLSLGNGAHDALNNILAAQGYTTADGMDYNGDGSKTYTWHQNELDTTTFAVSDTGAEITNQMDDTDLNYWQPDTVTYLSRQDWENTWSEGYEGIEITEDMRKYLEMDYYEIQTDEDISDIFPEKDNGLKFMDMKNVPVDDPKWDELMDQLTLDDCLNNIQVTQTQPVTDTSIGLIVDAYNSDGPSGFTFSELGARNNDPDSTTYVSKDDPNYSYTLADMVTESVVAATFNKDLARAEGELFGNDSLWANITVFYAPALNIHRSPYNARNDEYYSEDPILSSYTGGEMTSGALSKGCLIVAKHFAFNNQETMRAGVSTFMNEQGARETELRCFEGTVDAGLSGMMSSFNRIGLVFSSAHTGVMQNILRDEWGYDGYVQTDMMMSSYANYFDAKESIIGGTTQVALGHDDLTAPGAAWSYLTVDGVNGDATLCGHLRENMKYMLAAVANSNAMEGFNETTQVISTLTWWRGIYIGIAAISAILLVASGVGYVMQNRRKENQNGTSEK